MRIFPLPLLLLAGLPACTPSGLRTAPAAAPVAVRDSVTGTVAFRVPPALPAGAVLRVQLLDVTRAGVPAAVVAAATVPARAGQLPLAFSLPYDTLRIDRTNTYAVQAQLEAGGKLLGSNAAAYPVITRGNPKHVRMTLRH
jgi:putative lipoprotein